MDIANVLSRIQLTSWLGSSDRCAQGTGLAVLEARAEGVHVSEHASYCTANREPAKGFTWSQLYSVYIYTIFAGA
jgi:hypothetical protein